MSLWLGFSGRAEKIDYEFEDIRPHGPYRRKVACWSFLDHNYHEQNSDCVLRSLNAEICCS